LLHKNSSTTTQIVPTVRVPSNFDSFADHFIMGAVHTTVQSFLVTFAIRLNSTFGYNDTDLCGIDYASSQTAPQASIAGVHVPTLFMGMTGHYEYLTAEKIYLNSPASDKRIAFVEGAQHRFQTRTECERYPGEFGDTVTTMFDFIAGWAQGEGRFVANGTQNL
jgi:hypothetical protein